MTTTTFEFGYLFGGVENISFNDKIAAITQAHKQGYSYVVERRETFDEGEREVVLRLIGWGFVQVINKENLIQKFEDKQSTVEQIRAREDNEKKFVYCSYDNSIADWEDKRNFMEADVFTSIEILPKATLKKLIYG